MLSEMRADMAVTKQFQDETKKFQMKTDLEFKAIRADLKDMDGRIYCLGKRVDQNSAGLGLSFEKISAEWLKVVLEAEGSPNITIITNKKFEDRGNIVNQKSSEFEVDIFSETPLIAVE